MATYSNQLTKHEIKVASSAIANESFKPSDKTDAGQSESLEMRLLHEEYEVCGYKLKTQLLVELRQTWQQCLASTGLEGVIEYGVGKSDTEAIVDLVSSLGDYKASLMKRKDTLGQSAIHDLEFLERLIG